MRSAHWASGGPSVDALTADPYVGTPQPKATSWRSTASIWASTAPRATGGTPLSRATRLLRNARSVAQAIDCTAGGGAVVVVVVDEVVVVEVVGPPQPKATSWRSTASIWASTAARATGGTPLSRATRLFRYARSVAQAIDCTAGGGAVVVVVTGTDVVGDGTDVVVDDVLVVEADVVEVVDMLVVDVVDMLVVDVVAVVEDVDAWFTVAVIVPSPMPTPAANTAPAGPMLLPPPPPPP